MPKVMICECGLAIRGEDDEELLDNAEKHLSENHPALAASVTREDLLSMAEEE